MHLGLSLAWESLLRFSRLGMLQCWVMGCNCRMSQVVVLVGQGWVHSCPWILRPLWVVSLGGGHKGQSKGVTFDDFVMDNEGEGDTASVPGAAQEAPLLDVLRCGWSLYDFLSVPDSYESTHCSG